MDFIQKRRMRVFRCIFCVGKESLEVFREDFKEFSEVRNRVTYNGLVTCTEDEDTFVQFDVIFSKDVSVE